MSAAEEAALAASGQKDSFKKRQEDAKKKQSGELPPDVDQDGKMINPHNPDFITKVPWYLGDSGPTLKHHNVQKVDHFLSLDETDKLIKEKLRQKTSSERAVHFRKGACKNCGAMTHKEKDCVERPRSSKKAAWKSGLDIAPDEASLNLTDFGKVSYDAKRDQWSGYDPTEYKSVLGKYERVEAERRRLKLEERERLRREAEASARRKKEEKRKKQAARKRDGTGGEVVAAEREEEDMSDMDSDSGSEYDSDEEEEGGRADGDEDDAQDFIENDESARDFQGRSARQGGVGGAQMKVTVRNLRLREDTPKYLRNLDLNSAFYDPKTRSMRMNPLPDENPDDLVYAGDNFVRHSGDALALAATQVLCWEMQNRGEGVDVISNPSQAELLQKQFVDKKKHLEAEKKAALFERYGVDPAQGASEDAGLDPRLRLGQTESYLEYSSDGRVVKGAAPNALVTKATKYEEDVYINNHTSVWGSYFSRARMCWGFACCHSLTKNSYCTGEKGRMANDSADSQAIGADQAKKLLDSTKKKTDDVASVMTKRSDVFGEFDSNSKLKLDERKVSDAVQKYTEWEKNVQGRPEGLNNADDRKRGYNSMSAVEITPEDMEAYRLKKSKREDPMAHLTADEVLPYEK